MGSTECSCFDNQCLANPHKVHSYIHTKLGDTHVLEAAGDLDAYFFYSISVLTRQFPI